MIGSRGRVSEVLSRKRPLTLPMIRRLAAGLGIRAPHPGGRSRKPAPHGFGEEAITEGGHRFLKRSLSFPSSAASNNGLIRGKDRSCRSTRSITIEVSMATGPSGSEWINPTNFVPALHAGRRPLPPRDPRPDLRAPDRGPDSSSACSRIWITSWANDRR
jgi:hypothetical protein